MSLAYPLVSVIVLNYNGRQLLHDYLPTVINATYPNFEILLVDNSSTDDSLSFTRQNYPKVEIVKIASNVGYSKAYNIAFRRARGKYFVLLNNDVKVEPDWLQPLVEAAESDRAIAALQPKVLSMTDSRLFEYAGASGGFMDIYGYPFLRGRVFHTLERDSGQYDDIVEVFWTSGAAMFLRAEALGKSNQLDEDFFLHMEEIDLCWRLRLCGFKLQVIPSSRIYHHGGASLSPDSFRKLYWNFRNSIFMLIKNYERRSLIRILPRRYLLDALAIIVAVLRLDIKALYAIVKAHLWLLLHVRLILRKREDAQKRRILSDDDIQHVLYGKSIVVQYFLRGRKTFSDLTWNRS